MEPQPLPDWLEDDFIQAADNVWSRLHVLDLVKPLPKLTRKVQPDRRFTAEIQAIFDEDVIARFKTGCFEKLYATIERCDSEILAAVTHDLADRFDPAATKGDVLGAVHTLATHFVLAHELSHILCGHLRRSTAALAEALPAQSHSKPEPSVPINYVIEMEADNTGLQIMLCAMRFGDLIALLDESTLKEDLDVPSISELTEANRVIAYRCLLTAAWVVVGLFEEDNQQYGRDVSKYPLPSARLYAAVDTVQRIFAGLHDTAATDGGLYATLSEENSQELNRFLREVLRPVVIAMTDVPSPQTGQMLLSDRVDTSEETPAASAFVKDVGGLLRDQPLETKGAKELLSLQPLRSFVNEQLSPYRYLRRMSNV